MKSHFFILLLNPNKNFKQAGIEPWTSRLQTECAVLAATVNVAKEQKKCLQKSLVQMPMRLLQFLFSFLLNFLTLFLKSIFVFNN